MDFPENFFDFSYTVNTVYFWPDLAMGYREAHRTLKPGGVFANVFYCREWLDKLRYTADYGFQKHSAVEMETAVRDAGFSRVRLVELKKGNSYYILARKMNR